MASQWAYALYRCTVISGSFTLSSVWTFTVWTCLVQVRHSEHQDDEDYGDVDDGHMLGITHMYGAEVGRRRVGGCEDIWGEQNIHQFDNILFRIEIIS